MRNTASAIFTILMLSMQLPSSASYTIGVKPGDWIRYEETFYQKQISHQDEGENRTVQATFDSLIQILETDGTMITFSLTQTNRNGTVRWRYTYTADPTRPYYDHPELAVHHYLIPSNLSAGSPLPEPILLVSGMVGNVTRPAWSQLINETRTTNVLGEEREANYVHWTIGLEAGHGAMRMERECLFDRETGVALSFTNNSTTTFLDERGFVDTYVEFHQYRVKYTNMWGRPLVGGWGAVALAVLIVLPFSFMVFHMLKPRRGPQLHAAHQLPSPML